jgi:hypothetical protein
VFVDERIDSLGELDDESRVAGTHDLRLGH